MADILVLASILGALFVGAVSPGPSFVLVSRISLSGSRRDGMYAAVGMGAGGAIFATLALLGLIALLQQVPWLYLSLKVLGGLYLLHLGIKIWRGATSPVDADPELDTAIPKSAPRSFFLAFTTQIANPKTAIVYASIFASLLPENPSWNLLLAIPPAVFLLEALWYSTVALLLSASGPRKTYVRSKGVFDRIAGGVLALLGARLILSDPRAG